MAPPPHARGAVVVMGRRRHDPTLAGLWTLAAGWAAAARRSFGDAWVLTPAGVAQPDAALSFAEPDGRAAERPGRPLPLPTAARVAAADLARAAAGRSFRDPGKRAPWRDGELVLVWQHHDLFSSPGASIAARHRCPLVAYVDAPEVWEARRWGIRRPGYGRLLERFVERPQLRAADVVACVSDEVAREVACLGIDASRILVSPTAVDPERFAAGPGSTRVRMSLGLRDAFVVGWSGTFRRFQGLETLVEGFGRLARRAPDARLLLVGEGAERPHIESMVQAAGLAPRLVCTGAVPPDAVADHVAAMDVAVVSARPDQGFHYSPLKLREYLACGVAVVAARVGEIPRTVREGIDAVLFDAGDAAALGRALTGLRNDPGRRARIGSAGRERVLSTATWDLRLSELLRSEVFQAAAARRSAAR